MTIVIASALLSTPPTPPLTHARIGIDSIATEDNVSATSAVAGRGAKFPVFPSTFDFWEPTTVPAQWAVNAGAAVTVDYFGIAAHTAGTAGSTLVVRHSPDGTGGSWTDLTDPVSPATDDPILFLFPPTTDQWWDVRVSVATCAIGVIFVGQALAMQRPIYGGHAPITLSRQTVKLPNRSEGGHFLGRSIVREGLQTSFAWQHLTAAWYRANFDPFIGKARTRPFFIGWRPLDFSEAAYGSLDDDVAPSNMGVRDLMSVSMTVRGLGAVA